MRLITASTPGRCGIVGNPTDMYGGNVLSCTVSERAECRIVLNADSLTVHNSGETAKLCSRDDLTLHGDVLDIARAALQYFDIDPARYRFDMHLNTAIPMRAGLAGSTAMLGAIVGSLNTLLDLRMNRYDIAETLRKIEARIMGIVCGFQDQHMTVFGGLNFMTFAGKESLDQREDEPLAVIEPLSGYGSEAPFVLAHTGVEHHSGAVHRSPRERWLAGDEPVISGYARIAALAPRAKRALIQLDWPLLGALMNENHAIVAGLGGSGIENDRLVDAALRAGAWGAKLAGAGGGGTIIALAKDTRAVGEAMLTAGAERLLTPAPAPGLQVTVD